MKELHQKPKSLEQHLQERRQKPDWPIYNEKEVKEAVAAWLTDYRNDIGNKIYSDHPVVAETIFDELLGDLNK